MPTTMTTVPDMRLRDQDGREVSLRERDGKTLVLYFYPKDDTPGCTKQACDLRDNWAALFADRDDVEVYGVSPDDGDSHRRFRAKFDLPFDLLVDEDHQLAEALGLWVEKNMYGRKYWGVERSTVIIDPAGRIQQILRKVRPEGHAELVNDALTTTTEAHA